MNYQELFEIVKGYVENDFPDLQYGDPTANPENLTSKEQLDTFIRQAEQRIYNTVQFPTNRRNVNGVTTNGNKYLAAPTDFLAVYSLAVILPSGDYEYLLDKDVNFIRSAYPSPADSGVPKYYAVFGPATTNDPLPVITNELTFLLGPTPNANFSTELHYYAYPESIVTASTTWLGDNFDSVLLYGTLLEAYTFMKGEKDVIDNYTQRYNEALAQAKRLGDGMLRQDAYRNGQVRVPVR